MPDFDTVVQIAAHLPPLIPERKLDFLLGKVEIGPAASKSAQRGFDFTDKLGLDRVYLRDLLEQQITEPDLPTRVSHVRENKFGGPLLSTRTYIYGTNGIGAHLASSWEVTETHLRLVTAWVEIDKG